MVITKIQALWDMKSELDAKYNWIEKTQQEKEHLLKVDTKLIEDLQRRDAADPTAKQTYMLEVFTEPDVDSESIRDFFIAKSGQSLAVYDSGTHFVVHQKLTMSDLKEISKFEGVLEITGEYTGDGMGTWAASHERRNNVEHEEPELIVDKVNKKHPKVRVEYAAAIGGGIVAAIAVAAALIGSAASLRYAPSSME